MIWQDVVLSLVNVVFVLALLPSVLGAATRPPALMSALTSACLFTCAATQATIMLNGTAVVTALLALLWAVLAWQSGRPAYRGAKPLIVFEWRELKYKIRALFPAAPCGCMICKVHRGEVEWRK